MMVLKMALRWVLLAASLGITSVAWATGGPINLDRPLTLKDCLAIALENNPGMKQAESRVTSAQAGVLSAGSGLLPQVSVRSGWTRSGPATRTRVSPLGQLYGGQGGSQDAYSTSFSFSQSLVSVGQWAEVARARGARDEASGSRESYQRSLILEVKKGYYTLLQTKQLAEVSQATVEQSQEQMKRAQVMFNVGTARKTDLLKAEANLAEAQLNLITAKNNIRVAQGSLCVSLGLEPGIPLDLVEDTQVRTDSLDLATCLRDARLNRPELAQTRSQIAQARAQVWSARSRWLPSLSASGDYGTFDTKFPRSASEWTDHDSWSVGLSASLSLFDGFSNLAGLRQARAAARVSEREMRRVELQVALEVEQAYLAYNAAMEKMAVTGRAVESAQEDYRLTTEEYRLGAATMLDLLTSQVALTQAKVNRVQAFYDFKVALAEVEQATGKVEKQ